MNVTICLGSACHTKGAAQIVSEFQSLIAEHKLADKVELAGTFCMNKCGNSANAVSVTVDGTYHSLEPKNTAQFFKEQVLAKVK
jgi:NADH:ubiquinone oxidoreductase subunit E